MSRRLDSGGAGFAGAGAEARRATEGRPTSGRRTHRVVVVGGGFQNRLLVVLRWTFSFLTRGRGARLIVETAGHNDAEHVNTHRPPSASAGRARSGPNPALTFRH